MSENVETVSTDIPTLNDFETDVFNAVYSVLVDALIPEGNFRSQKVYEFETFPAATLIRMDSYSDRSRESTSDTEDFAVDTYEANVYALSDEECKNIMNALAYRMRQMNFRRLSMRPVLNGNDTRISRMVARFEHRIDSRGFMYRT